MMHPNIRVILLMASSVALALRPTGNPAPAESSRVRVLLDTDTFNEMDDQFFVTYALMEPRFEIEGICATQYRVTEASVDESYYEARRILNLMGMSGRIPLRMGSDTAMPDPQTPRSSPASRFIVERALAKDPRPLHILAVGALTNVASAYLENKKIRDRIRIIWLGGSRWPEGALSEFNAVNDRAAVKCIIEAGLDLTQIPTETCAQQLTTTFAETERRLRHRNAVADYLIDLYRDYGHDQKVIWDMTAVACLLQQTEGKRFFTITDVPAPRVDEATLKYIPNPEGARMKVCTGLDREKIFADFYARFPPTADLDPPYLTLACSRDDPRAVTLTFNEDLDPDSVRSLSGFRLQPDVPVRAVQLVDARTVRLQLAASLDPSTAYTVACSEVRDVARNPVGPRNTFRFQPQPEMHDGLRATLYAAGSKLTKLPVPELSDRTAVFRGQTLELWLSNSRKSFIESSLKAMFVVILEGNLEVPFKHEYEISCYADDAARIELDGRLLVEADLGAGSVRAASRVHLDKGLHPVRISFLQRGGQYLLNLYWNFPFHEKQRIPWNYFCFAAR